MTPSQKETLSEAIDALRQDSLLTGFELGYKAALGGVDKETAKKLIINALEEQKQNETN